jgi:hypothetical protein
MIYDASIDEGLTDEGLLAEGLTDEDYLTDA